MTTTTATMRTTDALLLSMRAMLPGLALLLPAVALGIALVPHDLHGFLALVLVLSIPVVSTLTLRRTRLDAVTRRSATRAHLMNWALLPALLFFAPPVLASSVLIPLRVVLATAAPMTRPAHRMVLSVSALLLAGALLLVTMVTR